MVARTKPQQRKEERKRLRVERDREIISSLLILDVEDGRF